MSFKPKKLKEKISRRCARSNFKKTHLLEEHLVELVERLIDGLLLDTEHRLPLRI